MKKIIPFSLLCLLLFNKVSALTYTVNSTSDASTGAGTTGTLRWCITQANLTAGADIINFSVAGTFTAASAYPTIIYPLTINGFSAPGAVQGQLGLSTRVMKIIINGPGNSIDDCFDITSSSCVISGIVIQYFYIGIKITGGSSNFIWGNYIGTSADGLSISATTTCYDDGIRLNTNANNNIIGTNGDGSNDANEGNLITGNGNGGVQYLGEGIAINEGGTITNDCSGTRIAGNFIGTDETGTVALYPGSIADQQRGSGIQVNYSTATIIGTNGDGVSDTYERNVISGNTDCGIVLSGATGCKIKGNYIGTTKTGLVGLPNYGNEGTKLNAVQITVKSASNNNYIGTDGDGVNDNIEGNIFGSVTIANGSANISYNYAIYNNASTGNRYSGNYFGIGANGTTALNLKTTSGPYIDKGIYLSGSSTSCIVGTNGDGTSDAYEANYFGNTGSGVTIDNSNSCIVAGNYFGLGTNLTTAETLSSSGVYILNSTSCRVGSSASNSLETNYFCNSSYDGVWIDGFATTNNDANNVRYNTFGLRPDGVAAANAYHAIEVYRQSNANTIQYNTISQNGTITPDGTYSALLIGGPNASDESIGNTINNNTIYKNIGRGIDILGSLSVKNKITQNSIYNNGNSSNSTVFGTAFSKYSLGIDLDWDGTTANDNKDPDSGPNTLLNFPIITGTASSGTGCTSATISGTYNGPTTESFYVELFSSDVCNGDTAGTDYYSNATYNYGEGRTYLGASATFSTNSQGNGTWTSSVPLTISGKYITAVAIQTTTNIGNTSEFSQCYPIAFDAGDAPDTYYTLLASCGPTHFGVLSTLKIGSAITADGDGQPSAAANLDTDEGITTLPSLTVASTSYTLSNIPVTNTTGSTATMYAWIDFNRNGAFEVSEYTSASVANNATTATLTWNLTGFTCGTTLVSGLSYLRMRLTTDALTDVAGTTAFDERCYGRASNGEVEDYKIYISGYDYGDLSISYPVAKALCLEDTATSKVWGGVNKPDMECTQNYSADATGDGSDEDGLTTAIGPWGTTNNWVIKLSANQASKTVYYGLWLDWNGDASFTTISPDAFYSGSSVVTGSANINVAVQTPFTINNAMFRLIVSDAPLTSTMYNATITNGEVEDYSFLKILASPGNILIGKRQAGSNLLKWKNTSALPVTNFVVERSTDNLSWSSLGLVTPLSGNTLTEYSYTDVNPGLENYYRLQFSFADSTYQYSNIVPLFDRNNNNTLPVIIYPNPATNTLTIQTQNNNYTSLQILDLTGRTEINNEIKSLTTVVGITNLSAGTHLIKFITKDGSVQVQRFVKIK